MTTDTENNPVQYSMSEIPDFIIGSKKSELTLKELEYQCKKLNEENHQLQMRILGVNELARLLQDRNEVVAVLKDRNKRLEMSLVRLENRCASFERQIKSQKNSGVPSVKQGQSPFIPGPSRQILEGLMQENCELKKTVNNLQKKGSSGYLEAVKTTQLEEFIDQQRLEIDQLRGQINSLTSSGGEDEERGVADGGGMSLPTNVTDSGPLRRQLLKMQQTMSVKDRFCSLLSQQVTELQKKLSRESSEKASANTDRSSSSENRPHEETAGPPSGDELEKDTFQKTLPQYKKILEELKSSLITSKAKVGELQANVGQLNGEKEDLRENLERTSQLYSTLLAERSELRGQVETLQSQLGGEGEGPGSTSPDGGAGGGGEEGSQQLRKLNTELQKIMDDQVERYTSELKKKDLELNERRIELEESNMKFAQTDSMLMSYENQLRHKENACKQKETELKVKDSKILELEDSNATLESINYDMQKDLRQKDVDLKKAGVYGKNLSMAPSVLMSGGPGLPNLIGGGITPGLEPLKDSLPPGLKMRDPPPPEKTAANTTGVQQHIPQQHVSQQHALQQHGPQQHCPQQHGPQQHVPQQHVPQQHGPQQHVPQQHGQGPPSQMSKPAVLYLPPQSQQSMAMVDRGQRTRSPVFQSKGYGYVPSALPTPTIAPHSGTPIGRPHLSFSSPTPLGPFGSPAPLGPFGTGGYLRSTSASPMTGHVTGHMRSASAMQPSGSFSGSPSPRLGPPGSGGAPLTSMGFPVVGRSTSGGPRMSTTPYTAGPPPPLPPRSAGSYHHSGMGGQGQVFGAHSSNFSPPMPRPHQGFHHLDAGFIPGSYLPTDLQEVRGDRPTGSTSPHPPHENPSMHPYGNGGSGGPNNGPQPPHYQ